MMNMNMNKNIVKILRSEDLLMLNNMNLILMQEYFEQIKTVGIDTDVCLRYLTTRSKYTSESQTYFVYKLRCILDILLLN